ncbi:hypothetical protein E4U57_006189 [Claviceps arundinis]|uniref:Uncharacterized protein n=1 Tax=Claviceps arundinis TaxID=1623583 RepID=A0A9P7MY10_9HYPO|nr:hypothetical protein E4U57_006189 [Claviceps arundinis]KAG5972719.1 hypothetical protein E4U56_005743 [Claviceps arundinis]
MQCIDPATLEITLADIRYSSRSLPRHVGGEPFILSPLHPNPVASEVIVAQPPETLLHDTDETHDYDPNAPHAKEQHQQHSALLWPLTHTSFHPHDISREDPIERLSSPASSVSRSLRRTPKFEGSPVQIPELLAAASVGFTPSAAAAAGPPPFARARPDSPTAGLSASLIQDGFRTYAAEDAKNLAARFETETPSDRASHSSPSQNRCEPHQLVPVSSNTHSAIVFALEGPLRLPNPFTPDEIEESADMADLMAAASGMPTSTVGHGTAVPRYAAAGPAPTTSPSGIRGPRIIMQERVAREARQRAEAERLALERSRAENEARLLEETRRRTAERTSAGVASGQGTSSEPSQQHIHQDPRTVAQETVQPPRNPTVGSTAKQSMHHHHHHHHHQQQQQQQQQFSPPRQQQQMPHQFDTTTSQQQLPTSPTYVTSDGRPQPQQQQGPGSNALPLESTITSAGQTKPRISFPHAFERWETLSAHWEGLTSYWIRKLEQNKDDINRDPLSQQLARQVTDLSAAGANLFHAVVELQRLRASSERKFQRWFFETRTELERNQEVTAMLEKALERERRDRDDAIREAVEHERGSSKAQKQLAEMRKELTISKDEARRAWEELGRREQEERDRTLSLQSGKPTMVGGVQVVPMTHGSGGGSGGRQATARDAAVIASYERAYGQNFGSEHLQGQPAASSLPSTARPSLNFYHPQSPSQEQPQIPSSQSGRAGGLESGPRDEGEYIIDATGNYILDSRGQKIPLMAAPPSGASMSDLGVEECDSPATNQNEPREGRDSSSVVPPTSSPGMDDGKWTGTFSEPQDYSGQGYGTPGWETVPRHHHPTRLSDVMEEEDERSRTSATQSRAGQA